LTLPGFVPILFSWEDPMEDPRIVANYLLDVAARKGVAMTNLKLQKLLFFAHAICLTEQKAKLVSGYFEAWQYGPVHPTVYQAFKAAGPDAISFRADSLDPVSRLRRPLPSLCESTTRDICDRVMLHFGRMSAGLRLLRRSRRLHARIVE
jgi:uncharacterized phage-associated protein